MVLEQVITIRHLTRFFIDFTRLDTLDADAIYPP